VIAVALAAGTVGAQSWRAAALASFDDAWQTIRDTFYEPDFGGLDWPAVSRELRPRVEAAATPDEARAVIREMLARLKRSHFGLLSGSAADALPGPASVPIDVRITEIGAVITRVTDAAGTAAGLTPGQRLLEVNGKHTSELLRGPDATERLDPRAAALESWRRVNQILHGAEGSTAALRVEAPDGAEKRVNVRRVLPAGETITVGNLPPLRLEFNAHERMTPGGRRAGIIAFSIWMTALNDSLAQAVDRFRRHDGIVLDLRGNPGGLAAMMGGVAGHFVAEPVLLGTMQTRQTRLVFNVNPRTVTDDGRKVDVFRGRLAILVDELTGSTSETFAGSLQGLGRARIVGRQTMGQALPALTRQLALGDVMIYAIGDYRTAAGKPLEGVGVIPDIAVPLSRAALAAGQDEAMEAALRWVDSPDRAPKTPEMGLPTRGLVAMLRPPASRFLLRLGAGLEPPTDAPDALDVIDPGMNARGARKSKRPS
jgi:carboxyl-terminal processing protease